MSMLNISDRLQMICSFVDAGTVVADIGCDHAYTGIFLVQQNKARHVFALDINASAIERARSNVEEYGLSDSFTIAVSNGLDALPELLSVADVQKVPDGRIDTIVISGMGGQLIREILYSHQELLDGVDCLVLSPQSHMEETMDMVDGLSFFVSETGICKERGKFYLVYKCLRKAGRTPCKKPVPQPLSTYREFLMRKLSKLEKGLEAQRSEKDLGRSDAGEELLSKIRRIKYEIDSLR